MQWIFESDCSLCMFFCCYHSVQSERERQGCWMCSSVTFLCPKLIEWWLMAGLVKSFQPRHNISRHFAAALTPNAPAPTFFDVPCFEMLRCRCSLYNNDTHEAANFLCELMHFQVLHFWPDFKLHHPGKIKIKSSHEFYVFKLEFCCQSASKRTNAVFYRCST